MKVIENHEFEKLINSGKVIEEDLRGPKIVLLAEDRYLKIFYHKSTFSMTTLQSRAKQFANHAVKLKKRGITTAGILDVFRTKDPRRDCVCYHGIPGNTLRDVLSQRPQDKLLSRQLGRYIAQLHNAGVMFSSLHIGNIIQLADGSMGLIDIADMRINIFTLYSRQRKRNFQHIFRYQQDRECIHLEEFEAGYLEDIATSKHAFYQSAIRSAQPTI
ncbi:MAG: toluene tolerance protein [Cellvibrionaceae bacterium]|nr:toluene tolerance protein [Cellvibrionaceae bacterium]|tara:strand:- start:19332 stop:19979 length:648 start_codon:yes stop_codon:yes gene_type:complete